MKQIPGGVTTPKGFRAWGVHCGVKSKKADKEDLALVLSDQKCIAAAVYTINRIKTAPLYVTVEHLENGTAWDVAANNGNASAYYPMSHRYTEETARLVARTAGHAPTGSVVAFAGVIDQTLNIAAIRAGMSEAATDLTAGPEGSDAATRAIMTTDTMKKELALTCSIGGRTVTLGAIAKGSGTIHPSMGTTLYFVTTDCAITQEMLSEALRKVVPHTFNRVTIDGGISTDDICAVLASGMAGNPLIEQKDDGYTVFLKTLRQLCQELARAIAEDDEGASHLIICAVRGTRSEESAEHLVKAVVGFPLVRAVMFGTDANWDRMLYTVGYSKVPFYPKYVNISFSSAVGAMAVCRDGTGLSFDEETVRSILSQDEMVIDIHLYEGEYEATCWGYDLTYEYVKINGNYRT